MGESRPLDDEHWDRLQEIAERFEKDCASAFPREISPYLPSPGDPLRSMVLDELLRIDLELHWRQGKGNRVEEYFSRFPELTKEPIRFLELIEEEYLVRGRFGDRPEVNEYLDRFPDYKGQLAQRLTSHASGEFRTLESAIEIPFATTGNLQKVRRIGEGGFGEVWECKAPGGVPVAVKRLFATVSPRFIEREKQSLDLICSGKFRHPFLLQVFGWWVQNNQIHIVMELADESLADRLKRARAEGKVGLDADNMLRRIVRDAGEALDFLNHRCHILHRDVKPANMLLMGDRLKLCDFGLARMAQNLSPVPSKTLGAGTPVFIAPEIVQGYQSMQSDQYSLAASYCMLRSGRPLFRGTINEIKDQHVHAKPALEQSVFSAGEQRILAKALAKEPTDRFPTSTEFVLELLASIDDHSVGLALPANNSVASLAPPPNSVTVDDGGPAGITSRESQDFKPLKRAHAGKIGSNSTVDLRSSSVPLWAMAVALVVVLLVGFLLGGWVMSLGK